MTISEFKEASQKILSLESLDPLITVNALKKIQKLFIEYRTDAITVADPVIAEHKIKLVKGLKSKSYNSAFLHIINKVFGVESFFFLKGSSISSICIVGPKCLLDCYEFIFDLLAKLLLDIQKQYNTIVWAEALLDIVQDDELTEKIYHINSGFYLDFLEKYILEVANNPDFHPDNDELVKISKDFRFCLDFYQDDYCGLTKKLLEKIVRENRKNFLSDFLCEVLSNAEPYKFTDQEYDDLTTYYKTKYPHLKIFHTISPQDIKKFSEFT